MLSTTSVSGPSAKYSSRRGPETAPVVDRHATRVPDSAGQRRRGPSRPSPPGCARSARRNGARPLDRRPMTPRHVHQHRLAGPVRAHVFTPRTRHATHISTPPTRSRTAQPADTRLQVSLRETCAPPRVVESPLPASPQLSAHQSSRPRPWSSSRSRETSPTRCTVSIDCTATAHSRYWTPSVGESCRRSGSTPHSSR